MIGVSLIGSLAVVLAASAPRPLDVKSIDWEVPEAPIVLGETGVAKLKITATRADGTALDVAAPELWASTGTLSSPTRVAPGVFEASYTPPSERFPHVAILSALVEAESGPAIGFVALPLWGKGKLEVKTKPGSDVVVYLGNASFGPVNASERGVALVDIIAPPGPENAVAESRDPAGNVSSKTVPLSVPPFSRLALLPVDRVVAADGTGTATLLLFVVDKKGAPLFDATAVEVKPSTGRIDGGPIGLAPGLFRLRFQPGQTEQREAFVDVALKNAKGSKARATLRLIPGGPAKADLTLSKTELTADDDATIEVTAAFLDQAGNRVPRDTMKLTVDSGRLEARTELPDDAVGVRWVLPDARPPGKATLFARDAEGNLVASAEVTLTEGAPAVLEIDARPDIVADGRSALPVAIRAKDRAGTVVSAAGASLTVDGGEVVGLAAEGEQMIARFVPAPRRDEGRAVLRATLGDAKGERTVRLVPPPVPLLSVLPALRMDWNYGRFFAAGPAVHVLVRVPGLLDETLHVGANLAYLPSIPLPVESPDGQTLMRFHQAFPVTLEGAWRPLAFDVVRVHLGGGLGFTVGDFSLAGERSLALQRDILFSLGGELAVGVATKLGPGELEGMLRVGYFVPAIAPSRFLGSPVGASLTLGYRFGL